MTIERLETATRMSRIVKHNGTIYLCGQVCKDANEGIIEQTSSMLEKVDALLEQAGSDREHILAANLHQGYAVLCRDECGMGCLGSRGACPSSCLCRG